MILVAVPLTCGIVVGLFIDIWEMRSAAKNAVAKPPTVTFRSIKSAGQLTQVVDFHDNFG